MTLNRQFWSRKKVLLTGHTGFKGTWMSLILKELDADVCGYSLPLTPHSFFSESQATVIEHHEGDIADRNALEKVIENFKPEIIIHLASHSSLKDNDRIPDFILKTNIMGVVNLLDISRKMNCIKSIVIVTSDKCYKNQESEAPYTEDADLGGIDPYSVSKVCQELITHCYQKSFFESDRDPKYKTGIATARASNVIGPGDYNITRLIPYTLDCFKKGNHAMLRNPDAVRPWQYVLDVLWGYLLLAQKLYGENNANYQYNGAYNFGPEKEGFRKVTNIVNILSSHFSNAHYEFGKMPNSSHIETNILKLDSTKARRILNWSPVYTVEQMLRETAEFVIREDKGEKTDVLCKETIQAYIKKVI